MVNDTFTSSPKADGYFRKYTASCNGNMITIDESGSNNSTDFLRVDSYRIRVEIQILGPVRIAFSKTGTMYDRSGVMAIKGSEKLDLGLR